MKSLKERFDEKWTPEPNSGCHLWDNAVNRDGYGTVKFQGTARLAHRVAFYLENGYWPSISCHSCDVPSCVNPQHVKDGTQLQNMQERIMRGRNPMLNRTHCPKKHEYTASNTYYTKAGARICKSCACRKGR